MLDAIGMYVLTRYSTTPITTNPTTRLIKGIYFCSSTKGGAIPCPLSGRNKLAAKPGHRKTPRRSPDLWRLKCSFAARVPLGLQVISCEAKTQVARAATARLTPTTLLLKKTMAQMHSVHVL